MECNRFSLLFIIFLSFFCLLFLFLSFPLFLEHFLSFSFSRTKWKWLLDRILTVYSIKFPHNWKAFFNLFSLFFPPLSFSNIRLSVLLDDVLMKWIKKIIERKTCWKRNTNGIKALDELRRFHHFLERTKNVPTKVYHKGYATIYGAYFAVTSLSQFNLLMILFRFVYQSRAFAHLWCHKSNEPVVRGVTHLISARK